MWDTIFQTIKSGLAGAFGNRNDHTKYRVNFKKKKADGKYETIKGTVTRVSIEGAGATFELTLNDVAVKVEARAAGQNHADVFVNGTKDPEARLANPRIHFKFPSFKTLVDYPIRPVTINEEEYRIEVLYR